ncbi:MAG: PAS domain S-box protein [Gammaproteobacteria bacterium]|nr:PAS domain S-box protein [Gammaproteobacteria bacterium]
MSADIDLSSEAALAIVGASADAVILVDEAGNIVYVNDRAVELFGYQRDELLGEKVEVLVPDKLRELHRHERGDYHGQPHSRPLVSGLSLQALRKDGREFDAEIALTPVASGDKTYVCSIVRDLGAVETSEAYFQNLLESAPDAMIIIDHSGRIVISNGQAERLFGYSRQELFGMQVEQLIPQRHRTGHEQHRRDFEASPSVRPMGNGLELAGLRSDGSEFPVEISLSPVRSVDGQLVSSVIRDVTERKQMESELISARQSAERANKANTAFLAAASHDLRQPVQALSLINGALRRTVKNPVAQEMVLSQQQSLDAMTNLLNSLLDISRLDSGTIEPQIEEFPIKRLVDRLSAEFARQAGQKNLLFEAGGCGAFVRSDPNLLSEIIQNFVSNAIRYTQQGDVKLTCEECGDELWINVSDSGIGIEADQIENIFKEFHQIKSAGTNKEGFGLGLAIVRRLADLLGHEVKVTSTPGSGSCFSVCVPLARSPREQDDTAPAPVHVTNRADASGFIILIEDDTAVATAWELLLEAEGYNVAIAASAPEANAVVNHMDRVPDLIISDYHLLDGSTGVQAISAIRERYDTTIPAFIVSGDTSKIIDDARALHNCIVLSKPVNTDQLLQMATVAVESGEVPVE